MSDRTALARKALRAAMQLRRNLAIPREAPVNAFDVASMVGADVRFIDAPSLEGMFVRDPGLRVLLPSTKHRPMARILFSCAHEIGHHEFGHGTKADRYLNDQRNRGVSAEEEFLADSFAGHLLMPRAAILNAFARRKWNAESPTATQVFLIACELGVGYETLLTQMQIVLGLLSNAARSQLDKSSPKSIKAELLGAVCPEPMMVIDTEWKSVPIDVERCEIIMLPPGTGHKCILLSHMHDRMGMSIYKASGVGLTSLNLGSRDLVLRVARQHYVGPFSNRYLPDPDEH